MRCSLVLVTVDCLRADHVGFLGYDRPTTPCLDALARRSLIFEQAVVAGTPTYYSFPAILASRPALALGRDVIGLAPGEVTLATTLRDAGYSTAAFLAGNPYLTTRFGYSQGFDRYEDFLGREQLRHAASDEGTPFLGGLRRGIERLAAVSSTTEALAEEFFFQYGYRAAVRRCSRGMDSLRKYPAADVVVDRALDWVGKNGHSPVFLWIHLMDTHYPYFPPPDSLRELGRPDLGWKEALRLNGLWSREHVGEKRLRRHRDDVVALYDAGVRWVDAQTGRLVQGLRDLGHRDRTVLAVTSDHGEEFLEHGGRYHPPLKLVEELIHVPLLIHTPGMNATRRARRPFGLLDLAPTLLGAIGVDPPAAFRGRVWDLQQPDAAGANGPVVVECVRGCTNPSTTNARLGSRLLGVRDSQYKLVIDCRDGSESLFDLEADPREARPLADGAHDGVRRALLLAAREHLRRTRPAPDAELRLRARLVEIRRRLH